MQRFSEEHWLCQVPGLVELRAGGESDPCMVELLMSCRETGSLVTVESQDVTVVAEIPFAVT